MLKRVFSSIFLILLRPPDTVLAFIFLVLLWSVGNSMSPGRSGMEKRLPFFSWILGMWGPPFFFSCTILLRSSLKTRWTVVERWRGRGGGGREGLVLNSNDYMNWNGSRNSAYSSLWAQILHSPNMLVLTVRERCVLFLKISTALEKEMFSKFWPLISMIWNKRDIMTKL